MSKRGPPWLQKQDRKHNIGVSWQLFLFVRHTDSRLKSASSKPPQNNLSVTSNTHRQTEASHKARVRAAASPAAE